MKTKNWRFIKKHESSFNRHCARQLYDHIKKNKDYSTTITGLMDICGIKCDMDSVHNYSKFHGFLVKQRKQTDEMFAYLFDSGWFEIYKTNGHSENEIYDRFIQTCLSYEIIPLYCDIDNEYKLIDLDSFLLIKKQRLRSAGSEIKHKFDSLKKPMELLPSTVKTELNILRESPDIKQLQDARDELNRFLPEHEES